MNPLHQVHLLPQVFRQDFASADHVPSVHQGLPSPVDVHFSFVFGELTSNKLYFGQQTWWFNEQQIRATNCVLTSKHCDLTSNKLCVYQQKWWFNEQQIVC